MKSKKLLVLSAALLMVLGVASCNNTNKPSSSSENNVSTSEKSEIEATMTDQDVAETAADSLWQNLKSQNGKVVTGDFNLPKVVTIMDGSRKCSVSVTWAIEIKSGTTEGVKLVDAVNDADKTLFQGVYVGYTDFVVTEETSFVLVPTLKFGTVEGTMASFFKDSIKRELAMSVKPFVFSTYDEYVASCKAAGSTASSKNQAAIEATVTGISSNGKYMFLQDANHGYLSYDASASYKTTTIKVGDKVIVSGNVCLYNGCYEFSGASIKLKEAAPADYVKPDYLDVTSAFDKATSNTDESLRQYQNMRVKITNATLTAIDGSYYYFTTAKGKKYNLYKSTSYFLNNDQNTECFSNFKVGMKATIRGVVNCYSNAHQIYPDSVDAIEITNTDAEKAAYVAKGIELDGYKKFYAANAEVALPSAGDFDSTITWAVKESDVAANVKVDAGKLVVTVPESGQVNATLVATVKVKDVTTTREFTIKTEKLTETQQVAAAKDELAAGLKATSNVTTTLPATGEVFEDVKITWAVKDAEDKKTTIKDGKVVAEADVDGTRDVTLVATLKMGETTETTDVKLSVTGTTSVSKFLTDKNKTDVQYIKGVVVAKNGTSGAGSFVIYDGAKYIFSYNSFDVTVGQEVVVAGKYGENNGFPQLATTEIVEVVTAKKDVAKVGDFTGTATEIVAGFQAEGMTKDAMNETYANKCLEITSGYVTKSGNYYGIGTSADATSYVINVYSSYTNDQLAAFASKEVKVYGVVRGVSANDDTTKNKVTIQVISIEEVSVA